jgi:hypothetical protein
MKEMSRHAAAAKAIRLELKKEFPGILFKVRSDSYAGGNSVDVSWIDGPTRRAVEAFIGKYQYGSFDGMTDSYNYSNIHKDIAQVKYVFANRDLSNEVMEQVFAMFKVSHKGWSILEAVNETSGKLMNDWGIWTAGEYIRRYLSDKDLTEGLEI